MLHVSELGYGRVEGPEEVLSLGQEIDVQILKIEPDDRPAREGKKPGERISLSLKALASDPWGEATRSLGEGVRVRGKVTRLQPFGAFVEIAPGVEGLVHISELGAGRRIAHPKEVVEPGQEVEAVILSVDTDKRRIALSMGRKDDAEAADVATQARAQAQAPAPRVAPRGASRAAVVGANHLARRSPPCASSALAASMRSASGTLSSCMTCRRNSSGSEGVVGRAAAALAEPVAPLADPVPSGCARCAA